MLIKRLLILLLFLVSFNIFFADINDGLVAYYPLDNISKFNSTVNGVQTLLEGSYGVEKTLLI
ncbi:MAG: hypothetical protein PF569_09560 [Candidatus Woesearchaeota archaeon]|jgi:hypothetical protein|nr:hypothetical protein [Candidatus Woesearchaeota archaeon]